MRGIAFWIKISLKMSHFSFFKRLKSEAEAKFLQIAAKADEEMSLNKTLVEENTSLKR